MVAPEHPGSTFRPTSEKNLEREQFGVWCYCLNLQPMCKRSSFHWVYKLKFLCSVWILLTLKESCFHLDQTVGFFGKPPGILSTCLDPRPPIFGFLLLHPFELHPETHFSGCLRRMLLHACFSTHVSLCFRGWRIHGAFSRWSLVLMMLFAKP